MSKSKQFVFLTDQAPEELMASMPAKLTAYSREMSESFVLKQTEGGFRLNMERGGVTDYWYCASVKALDNGMTRIKGRIMYKPRKKKIKKPAKFLRGVVYPFLTVIFGIPVLFINLIEKLTRYIQDLPRPLTYEEKLVQFMTERMKCTEFIKEEKKEEKQDS